MLTEQMRQVDTPGGRTLLRILKNLREGIFDDDDWRQLNARAIGMPGMPTSLADPRFVRSKFVLKRHSQIHHVVTSEIGARAQNEHQRLVKFFPVDLAFHGKNDQVLLPEGVQNALRNQPMTSDEKIPHVPFVYHGMEAIHRSNPVRPDNRSVAGTANVDLGWTTNNACRVLGLILDEREPPDDRTDPECWELQYLALGIVVEPLESFPEGTPPVNNYLRELFPDSPHAYIVPPTSQSIKFNVPMRLRRNQSDGEKKMPIHRTGFKLTPAIGATDFFSQGLSFRNMSIIIDLRIPPGNANAAADLVILSRATTLDDIYLMHELWPRDDEKAREDFMAEIRRRYKLDEDIAAEDRRLRMKADECRQKFVASHPVRHFVDPSQPESCICGAAIGERRQV